MHRSKRLRSNPEAEGIGHVGVITAAAVLCNLGPLGIVAGISLIVYWIFKNVRENV